MTPCDYSALREAAGQLARMGLSLQTVISRALPADDFPQTRLNSKTGQREILRDRNRRPLPAFVGKNPSFWLADGQPRLTSQSQPAVESEVLKRIDVAERLGRPIGLAVIPSKEVVVIDFDLKNYPTQEDLDQDWLRLLDLYPELTGTRIERTPGGGVHIYLRLADGMDSWRTAAGKLHCNFTTVPGGEHRGEVLAGTRVCVCAPTRNGSGTYELVNPEYAYSLI
ncbi:MAG: bifunctional DNA primase/polymerase, partial [Cyanobium sp.]